MSVTNKSKRQSTQELVRGSVGVLVKALEAGAQRDLALILWYRCGTRG